MENFCLIQWRFEPDEVTSMVRRNIIMSMEAQLDLQQKGTVPESRFLTNWPEMEVYFGERDEYIKKNKSDIENKLKLAGYEENLLGDMAIIYLRGSYLFNLMSDILKLPNKINTSLAWTPQMHSMTRGQSVFVIDVVGEDNSGEPRSFMSLLDSAKKGGELVLRKSQIQINLGEIKREINTLNRYEAKALEKYKDEPETGKEMKAEGLDLLGIKTERCVVEEVAHLLYVASVFKDKERVIKWLEQMKDYVPHLAGDDSLSKIGTDAEMKMLKEKYYDTEIELRASVLVKLFMNRYYPDFSFID